MKHIENAFVAANRLLVALTLAIVFLIVFANVVGRYGFGASFAWVEEVARQLMILCAFAGAGLALREGRLVAITILIDVLPAKYSHAMRWMIVVVMFVFMLFMTWLGMRFVQFGWNKETMSTGIPKGIPYMSIPIGCGLFLVHLAIFAKRFVQFNDTPNSDLEAS
nr:TRAP transporter small permease [uncultured Cohaesibacter sp.]